MRLQNAISRTPVEVLRGIAVKKALGMFTVHEARRATSCTVCNATILCGQKVMRRVAGAYWNKITTNLVCGECAEAIGDAVIARLIFIAKETGPIDSQNQGE